MFYVATQGLVCMSPASALLRKKQKPRYQQPSSREFFDSREASVSELSRSRCSSTLGCST